MWGRLGALRCFVSNKTCEQRPPSIPSRESRQQDALRFEPQHEQQLSQRKERHERIIFVVINEF